MDELLGFMKINFFNNNDTDLREEYSKLNKSKQWLCKRMLYANPFLKEFQKDRIWEYIIKDISYLELIEAIKK